MVNSPYTVVGYRLDSGESFVHWVEAVSPSAATDAAEGLLGPDPPAWEVCAVFIGHHADQQGG